MDRYTRWFVLASLGYLSIGAVLGLLMIVSPGLVPSLYFSHVHALLAGFMVMMVCGVGYFILPRFAARTLMWPSMVAVHFWMSNASLVVFLISKPTDLAGVVHASAAVQALSLLLFAVNLGGTLLLTEKKQPRDSPSLPVVQAPAAPRSALSGEMPVAEVVDRKQGARELLVEAGLRPLADPQHLEMVRARGVTLGHACSRHGIPLEALLTRLEELPDRTAAGVTRETIIGELVRRHPGARDVLKRRFGEGCFTCPGFETETLAQGAMMHGVAVDELLDDLREIE